MVASVQRGEVGVCLSADDGIEVYGVACIIDFLSGHKFFAVFIVQTELCSLVQHLEGGDGAGALLHRQRIRRGIAVLGDNDQNILFLVLDRNAYAAVSVQSMTIHRDGIAIEGRRGANRYRCIFRQDLIGIGKRRSGKGLVRVFINYARLPQFMAIYLQAGQCWLAVQM